MPRKLHANNKRFLTGGMSAPLGSASRRNHEGPLLAQHLLSLASNGLHGPLQFITPWPSNSSEVQISRETVVGEVGLLECRAPLEDERLTEFRPGEDASQDVAEPLVEFDRVDRNTQALSNLPQAVSQWRQSLGHTRSSARLSMIIQRRSYRPRRTRPGSSEP